MEKPVDNDSMTKKFLADNVGCCGQACLACIEGKSINDVIKTWVSLGLEWKGYSGWRQLRQYLEKQGYSVKQCRNEGRLLNMDEGNFYLARVQWLGDGKKKEKPFYGWDHWSRASAATHYLVIGENEFFCNETGVDKFDNLNKYLENNKGVITSFFWVTNAGKVAG